MATLIPMIVFFIHPGTVSCSPHDLLSPAFSVQMSVWYGILLLHFLNINSNTHKQPNRFISESEFLSLLPIQPKQYCFSRIAALSIVLFVPFLISISIPTLSPHLQITGKIDEISLLTMIQEEVPNSIWRDEKHQTLEIPYGSWIVTQLDSIIPLLILGMTLLSYYFLRNIKTGQIRSLIPGLFAFASPFFFHFADRIWSTQTIVNLFIWFSHWRYWVLGGLILSLIALILFLGEKAEAREEF